MKIKESVIHIAGSALDAIINRTVVNPLSKKQLMKFKEEASGRQPADVLKEMNLNEFIRTTHALYEHCRTTQRLVLQDIIRTNAATEYGKKYDFDGIRSVSDFRKKVPLTTWADYEPYVNRMTKGEEDILFPGKAVFFYRTSGTTSDFKYIPESEQEAIARKVLTNARYIEMICMTSVSMLRRIFPFFNRMAIDETEGGIPAGTASGRTTENSDSAGKKLMVYHQQLVEELEEEALYYTIMRVSLAYDDVSAILGNNAHMLSTMVGIAKDHAHEIIDDIRHGTNRYPLSEKVRELEKKALMPNPKRADELEQFLEEDKFTPRYYWPNLTTASFWLGGSVGVFVDEVRPLLPERTKYVDVGYGASEAKINIPIKPDTPAGVLSTFTSFYEFLPEEGTQTLLADELEDGKTYELVLTTYGGLYRYRLKDYVRVEGFTGDTPNIYFVSKASDVANLAQEKIMGSLLLGAIREIVEESGRTFTAAQVYPDPASTSYKIYIETDGNAEDREAFTDLMEEELPKKLIQYRRYRHEFLLLNPCKVYFMKRGWGENLTKKYAKGNATTAQVKVPVVVGEMPEAQWLMQTDVQ